MYVWLRSASTSVLFFPFALYSPDEIKKLLEACRMSKKCTRPLKKALKELSGRVSSECSCVLWWFGSLLLLCSSGGVSASLLVVQSWTWGVT